MERLGAGIDRKLDIAIAGCGPGGMVAALLLRQAGHRITIYERFPEAQPVGSGLLLQPAGQMVLARLGLDAEIAAVSAPVEYLLGLSDRNGRRALDVVYRFGPGGGSARGIHRSSLFDTLFAAVSGAGVAVQCGQEVTGFVGEGDRLRLQLGEDDLSPPHDLFVDASGARSPLRSGEEHILPFGALWATVDQPEDGALGRIALDQRYRAARQMAGIMPIGVNPATGNPGVALFWSVKPEDIAGIQDAGLSHFQQQYCALWPEAEPYVGQLLDISDLTVALYAHRTGRCQLADNAVQIGDAWHSTSPQLGQGANMAMLDAAGLAQAVAEARSISEIGPRLAKLRRRHVALYQRLSALFTPLYQSDSRWLPMVRDLAVHYGAGLPIARNVVARIVSGSLGSSINGLLR